MKLPVTISICIILFLAGCSGNMNRALYEGIQSQNEVGKTPAERAISPAPNYDAYHSERDKLINTKDQ